MKKFSILLVMFACLLGACSTKSLQSQSELIAMARAKEMFAATANCDIERLKELTTYDFYAVEYPESDSLTYSALSSVPESERQKMLDMIENHCEVTAETEGDIIIVTLENKQNGKEFVMRFMDTGSGGESDWRIFDYDKWH